MSLAALVLPERWLPESPQLAEHELEVLLQEQQSLVQLMSRSRPQEHSEEERQAFQHILRLVLPVDPKLLEVFRSAVETGLQELLSQEKAAQEAARQLALRHIEQAVNTLSVLVESCGEALSTMPEASWRLAQQHLAEALDAGKLPPMSSEERILLRFEFDLMMAIFSLDGPLSELTYWAHRAVIGSRRVQALSAPRLMTRWRGELARLRAKASWVDWDEEELHKELEPWPDDSPSP